MTYQQMLVLDHFFINASAEDFEALKKLKEFIPYGVRHDVVKAADDQWEGLYLRSRPGSYFEILRDRRPNALGLAFQTIDPMILDAAKITEELALDWKIQNRKSADGQPWFDYISISSTELDSLFVAWIMKYYVRDRKPVGTVMPRSIDRWVSLEMTLGRRHADRVSHESQWFPGTREITNDAIQFTVPDRDGHPFDIRIRLIDGDARFEFKKAIIDLYDTTAIEHLTPIQLGSFTLTRSGDSLILTR